MGNEILKLLYEAYSLKRNYLNKFLLPVFIVFHDFLDFKVKILMKNNYIMATFFLIFSFVDISKETRIKVKQNIFSCYLNVVKKSTQ